MTKMHKQMVESRVVGMVAVMLGAVLVEAMNKRSRSSCEVDKGKWVKDRSYPL